MNITKSKRQLKNESFHRQMKEIDTNFEKLQLTRPQDFNKKLLQRARQLNFGKINCKNNPNATKILSSVLSQEMLISTKQWKCYPDGKKTGNWVTTPEEFKQFYQLLSSCREFTIDLECHSHHSQKGFVSIIQIGTWKYGDFLLDPFHLRKEIETTLRDVLESENFLKIGHDVRNDSKWLQRDFDIFMTAAIDTQVMYNVYTGTQSISFSGLIGIFQPTLQKLLPDETLSDWRLRPGKGMTQKQEEYATNDVHILLRVFDQLRYEMQKSQVQEAFSQTKSRLILLSADLQPTQKTPNYMILATTAFSNLKKIKRHNLPNAESLSSDHHIVFAALLEWRDNFAKVVDEKPDQLLSELKLLQMVTQNNPTVSSLLQIAGKIPEYLFVSMDKPRQLKIIKTIIDTKSEYVSHLRKLECHNCLCVEHGPAWACPFPKNNANYKAWYNKKENKDTKTNLNNRRFAKLAAKVGEEKAKEIFKKNSEKRQPQ